MGSIDCVDKVCYLTYKIVESCVVYLATNNSECHIPCKLNGCQSKILNGVRCAIWTCEFYPTPIPIIPITTLPPPIPPPMPAHSVAVILLAIIGSFVLGVLIIFLARKYQFRLRNSLQLLGTRLRQLYRRNQPPFDDAQDSVNGPNTVNQEAQDLPHQQQLQPQRDFFAISLEEDEDSINFLNVTPPGATSTWHFHSVAGRFTEAAKETLTCASEKAAAKLSKESFKKLFQKSDYDQLR